MEYVKTDDTVYFSANFYHAASGYSVTPDTTPEWFVYENNTGAAILKGAMSSRSDFVGSYYGNFTASAANGFDSNSFYDVCVSGAVNNIHGMTSVKQFVLDDVYDSNVVQVSGESVTLNDFNTLTAVAVRTEMDSNSTQLSTIAVDVAGLDGDAMRGTDNAALAATALTNATWTDARAGYLDLIPNLATKTNLESVSGVLVARTLVSASYFDPAADTVAHVTLVDTTTDVTNNVNVDLSSIISKLDNNKLYLVAISGDTVAILADTDELQTNQGNWATATGFATPNDVLSASGAVIDSISALNNLSTAQVNAEVDTALADYDVATRTHLMSVSGSILDVNVVQVSGELVGLDTGVVDANVIQVSGEPVTLNDFYTVETDIYFASVKYIKDTTNTQDEYVAQWYKNDQPVGSGSLTSPAISVYNTSNGSLLIQNQLMTYASPNIGVVRYNEASNLLVSGEPYLVEMSGVIDSSLRVWKTVVGIDKL